MPDPVVAEDPAATPISDPAPPPASAERAPGVREALVVGGLTVLAVLLAASLTFLLPGQIGDVVFRTPLLIVVLVVGTVAVLLRITRPGPGTR